MSRAPSDLKQTSFNLRIEPELKAAFTAAAEAEGKPAARVIREFMRAYLKLHDRRAAEAPLRVYAPEMADPGYRAD